MKVLGPGELLPPLETADESGLLAAGGSLDPARLVSAYRAGVFPWPLLGAGQPMLWFSPDPRFVLFPEELHCSKSLQRTLRRKRFRVTVDQCFDRVLAGCSETPREGQDGTWITPEMIAAYRKLHELGIAHSVEVHAFESDDAAKERLLGGLYGLAIGRVFFGESMFSRATDASKVGFVTLVRALRMAGFGMVDCQQETSHLGHFGARPVPRREFSRHLEELLDERPAECWKGLVDSVQPTGLGGTVRTV